MMITEKKNYLLYLFLLTSLSSLYPALRIITFCMGYELIVKSCLVMSMIQVALYVSLTIIICKTKVEKCPAYSWIVLGLLIVFTVLNWLLALLDSDILIVTILSEVVCYLCVIILMHHYKKQWWRYPCRSS